MATSFRKQNKAHAGFTLMEVMVAVSIFAIVMTVGIGALLTINVS
jgi:prepilin-type N-terminal cleavage/methylation domain-containing protein